MEHVKVLADIVVGTFDKDGREGVVYLIARGAKKSLDENKLEITSYVNQLRQTTDIFTDQQKYHLVEVVNTMCNEIDKLIIK